MGIESVSCALQFMFGYGSGLSKVRKGAKNLKPTKILQVSQIEIYKTLYVGSQTVEIRGGGT